ncbi:DUF3549 family protein [Thalassotalea ponticola]|uniref:DUF3549 family protein n=1 Tax=Thalassotalea ponticola TaxID=1523392 RepID=UPI0025B4E6C7|nr:DUF3549 family protein [Thalassotalea ponticola]MDN3651580.1 DUF3549 family protein [Thalassotalea ponticola]
MTDSTPENKDTIDTISELLKLSNAQYRVYDIGRKVTKISKQEFNNIEQAMQPYPYPISGHAMFALVFWQQSPTAPYIWFVKLPLDERGLLNQAARNHYLAIIIEALGGDLSQDPSEKQEELLKANPYNFTPSQYKLASLNALVKRDLKQPSSQYYEQCQWYLSGDQGWDAWQSVAVQGLCDFAARIDDGNNSQTLSTALAHLPPQVLSPLCSALENQRLPFALLQRIVSLAEQQLTAIAAAKDGEPGAYQRLGDLLRAVSQHADHPHVVALADQVLMSNCVKDLNTLLLFTAKAWPLLADEQRLLTYLEAVCAHHTQAVFNAVFQDLVAIPLTRIHVLQCLRSPQRSDELINAIGALLAPAQKTQ